MTRLSPARLFAACAFVVTAGMLMTGPALADKSDFPEYDLTKFKSTKSGLKYHIVKAGSDKKPAKTDTVVVHYHGMLPDGRVFDSSYDRGTTIEFPLDRVIPGWTEGLQLIGEGGQVQLVIPPDLAYGANGAPGSIIGPNATLHFNVELVKIK